MTSLDATFPGIASELLAEFGVSAVLSRVVRSYDAETGREWESTEETTCKALAPTIAAAKPAAGGVSTGPAQTYIAGPDISSPPAPGDRISISGVAWLVQAVTAIRSGDLVAVYQVELATP